MARCTSAGIQPSLEDGSGPVAVQTMASRFKGTGQNGRSRQMKSGSDPELALEKSVAAACDLSSA
ncbi:MAG: hypothetical protein LBP28_09415 [Coriobacteriales bacterium]|jgi:hypothetical protein|nr:hypothetical protein [Coriobacteriales bacterium]